MPGQDKLRGVLFRWAGAFFFCAWAFYVVYHYVMQFRPIGRAFRDRLMK